MKNKTNKQKNIINIIRKAAVSVLGTAFFVGTLLLVGCVETESTMPTTYTLEGKVIHNEISGHDVIVTVDADGEVYSYYADKPVKLLTEVTLEMHNKGTLKKSDDEVIGVY